MKEYNFEVKKVTINMPALEDLEACRQDLLSKDGGIERQYEERNLDNFLVETATAHGFDSVALLISNHIKTQIWDGRYNKDVKDWAKNHPEIAMPEKLNPMDAERIRIDYTLQSTHPVIVNFACEWVMKNEKNKEMFQPKKDETTPSQEVFNRMSSELNKFKDWLLTQPPEEILNHAYEYTTKNDIIAYFECVELSKDESDPLPPPIT